MLLEISKNFTQKQHAALAAMPTGQPLSAHANILRSHSFAPGVPLANRDSQLHDSTLVQPPSSSASAVTSPGSQYNIPTTGVAIPGTGATSRLGGPPMLPEKLHLDSDAV